MMAIMLAEDPIEENTEEENSLPKAGCIKMMGPLGEGPAISITGPKQKHAYNLLHQCRARTEWIIKK